MSIRVLRPGLLTTVQDFGRHGHQHVGLCPGGAMDVVSLALANALVGNPPGAPALEITVIGPELQFEHDTLVALCGAEFLGGFFHNRPMLVRAKCAPHFKRIAYEQGEAGLESGGCMAGVDYCRITPEGEVTPCPARWDGASRGEPTEGGSFCGRGRALME